MKIGHYRSPDARERYRAAYAAAMATLPALDGTDDVDTAFGVVRVYRFGAGGGAPLVLLPGAGAPAAVWQPNIAGLAARRTVYAVDALGGPGGSHQEVPIRTADDQVRWLREVLEQLGAPRLHLVGTSMGAWHALSLAARGTERLGSVSLLEPANTFDRIPLATVLRSVGAAPFAPAWLRRKFVESLGGGEETRDDPVSVVVEAGMRDWARARPPLTYPSDEQLRRVTVPALVLLGGRSEVLDAQKARSRAEALLPDARVEVWPEATHALPGEFPEATVERVLAHVDGADGSHGTGGSGAGGDTARAVTR